MGAPARIQELAERFEANLEAYKKGGYKETQLRREFIDPFFEELGWDVQNRKGYAEAYKDVIHEDAIKVGGATKAPDYCFRVGGVRKFFLETKKPSIDIKGGISAAYQLRRYAWSAKLPLSILSDFEEFAVYDCRITPVKTDKASAARTMYLTFKDYLDQWDDLARVFSRDAILKGSFDKYVESSNLKRGTAEVDNAFLKEIERWRDLLARNIALRNPGLRQRDLNFAVQRTIDRIIFLRICEDRGIETYGDLMALENGTRVYKRLFELFHKADDRYNSGLFHFKAEKERPGESLDELTADLKVDDKVLKDVLKNLYYPDSPYEFSVLPADILGQVYERFLGSVIRLTPAHRAVVEEKPEVRKAGGVYYTPTYIVDYIVKNTVGKLLEGKKPGPRGSVSKLKILDPACGSGSFLLGAYQYLLDWHRDRYTKKNPERFAKGRKPTLYQGPGGEWRLTTAERKRILLNNIYGVDIDSQAVEVTKLSLLLKVLEGENQETIESQLRLFRERALPDLSSNIKCGNSLIGPDFYDGKQMALLDDEEIQRVNAFDWNAEFPDIMKSGGFDAVIGNPPYIGFHGMQENKQYFRSKYSSATGRFDIYVLFIDKGTDLLRPQGVLGYICPTNFMKREHGRSLRKDLRLNTAIIDIVDFQDVQIFKGALNYVCILILGKVKPVASGKTKYRIRSISAKERRIAQHSLLDSGWVFRTEDSARLIEKILSQTVVELGALCNSISEGIVTGNNDVFILRREEAVELALEQGILRLCARGKHIRRYFVEEIGEYVIYPYEDIDGRTSVISADHIVSKYPNTWRYLLSKKPALSGRTYFERSSKAWYELWCQRDITNLAREKIIVPELSDSNRFTMVSEEVFYGDTVCGISLRRNADCDMAYVLGILNSRLIECYYKQTTVPKANRFYIYKTMFLKKIPIRLLDLSDPGQARQYEQLCKSVALIVELRAQLQKTKTPAISGSLRRRVMAAEDGVDDLVYRLYRLTDDEIKIVKEEVPDRSRF